MARSALKDEYKALMEAEEEKALELPRDEEAEEYSRGVKTTKYFPNKGEGELDGKKLISLGHSSYAAFFNIMKGMSDNGHHKQVYGLLSSETPPTMRDLAKGIFFASRTDDKLLPQGVVDQAIAAAYAVRIQNEPLRNTFLIEHEMVSIIAKDAAVNSGTRYEHCSNCPAAKSKQSLKCVFLSEADALVAGKKTIVEKIMCQRCKQQTKVSQYIPNCDAFLMMPSKHPHVAIEDIFKVKSHMTRVIKVGDWNFVCKGLIFVVGEKESTRSVAVLVNPSPNNELYIIQPPDSLEIINGKHTGEVDTLFYVRTNTRDKKDVAVANKKEHDKVRLRGKAAALADGPRTLPPRAARAKAAGTSKPK